MSHPSSPTVDRKLAVRFERPGRRLALWTVQVVLAGMFLFAGGSKLAGVSAMVALFDAIGVGQWFRYVTGLVEVSSAVALLVPSLAPFGALALVATMIGAIVAHLFVLGGLPAAPIFLLLGSLAVVWVRRDQLAAVLAGSTQSQ